MEGAYYSLIGFLAIIIHMIINHDVMVRKETKSSTKDKDYRIYLWSVFFYFLVDVLWGIINATGSVSFLYVITLIYYVAVIASVFCWCKYVITYFNLSNIIRNIFIVFSILFCTLELIALVINHFSTIIFSVDQYGNYHAYFYRYISMTAIMMFFLAITTVSFVAGLKKKGIASRRNITIGIYGLAMVVAFILQIIFPLLPYYSMGLMAGSVVLHIFVQEDEKDEFRRILKDKTVIINNAGIGLWKIILKDGVAPRMQVDEKMAELLGISADDMTEESTYSSWYDRIAPEDLSTVHASVQDMIDGKEAENTYQWNHPTQGIVYVRCGGTCQKMPDGTNILSGYHGIVTEFVSREQAQKRLLNDAKRLAELHSEELTEQLDIINSVSKAFNFIYYVDMKDYSFIELGAKLQGIHELIGGKGNAIDSFEMMYKHLVVPEQIDFVKEFTDLTTLNERLKEREWISCQFLSPIGGWSEGIFIAAKRNEEGLCDHIIWATRDIDENKRREMAYQEALESATERAKSANAAKTSFLFNMSHDIRTPMNAIIGYTSLLEKYSDDPEKYNDYIAKIKSSSDFMMSLINNVLEMARIESGKLTINENVCNINDFYDEISNVYSEIIRRKNIDFTIDIDKDIPYFYCDKVKMDQILLNIISNSCKYTPDGGSINMKLEKLPCEKEDYFYMRITVADTGIGMSEDYLPTIFDEFSRENNTTVGNIQGTGLGMSIAKNLVDILGGSINVESKVGKGTTFIITMPHRIAYSKDAATNKYGNNQLLNKTDFDGKRILLAEDNDLNAEIIIELLNDYGFETERADDGNICVDKLKKSENGYYDLIMMDIQMPNLSGYDATKIIRGMEDPQKSQIPIIAMTANAFDEDKKNAIEAGMNAHLSKPINISETIKVLSEFIQ